MFLFSKVKPPPDIDSVIGDVIGELSNKESSVNVYKESGQWVDMTNVIFIFSDLVNNAEDLPSNSSNNMTQEDLKKIMDIGLKRIEVKELA